MESVIVKQINVIGEKYMISLGISFVVPLLFLIGATITNSILFTKKFEHILPFSMIECTLILYLSGFFNLRIGFILCILLCISSLPLLIIAKKYSLKEFLFTDFFWIFLILYSILFALNLGKTLSHWDEFSHWGVMAKELVRLDKYYYLEESPLLRHKDYPPFTTLLQYLWCNLCGNYKERHLYNAEMVFSLSLFLPILSQLQSLIKKHHAFDKKPGRHIIFLILMPLFIILTSLCCTIGEASFYQSIYTETIMACVFLYGLYIFIFEDNNTSFTLIRNTLFLSALLLVKQIAIYFFMILIIIYIIKQIRNSGLVFFKIKKQWLYLFCMLLIPLTFWFLWQNAVTIHAPVGQFDSSHFNVKNIIAFVTGHGKEYQYTTAQNYISALLTTPLIKKPFTLSYVPLIIILFSLFMGFAHIERDVILKQKIRLLGISEAFSCILYIGVMFISYLYGFSQRESLALACYNRYMNTILYPFILSAIFILLYVLYRNYHINIITLLISIMLGCIVILIPFDTLKYELRPGIFCENITNIYQNDCLNILKNTPENAKILVIRQNDTSSSINIIAYNTLPRKFDDDFFSFGKPYHENDIYTLDYTVEEFSELLKQFDYLYISKLDNQFVERYQVLFDNIKLTNNQTFKVKQTEDGKVILMLLSQ